MMHWPANPLTHLGADLADMLTSRFTPSELMRMEVTYAQLVRSGMSEKTEMMFKFEAEEWAMLGKPIKARVPIKSMPAPPPGKPT
jgi:hypothetical protein